MVGLLVYEYGTCTICFWYSYETTSTQSSSNRLLLVRYSYSYGHVVTTRTDMYLSRTSSRVLSSSVPVQYRRIHPLINLSTSTVLVPNYQYPILVDFRKEW